MGGGGKGTKRAGIPDINPAHIAPNPYEPRLGEYADMMWGVTHPIAKQMSASWQDFLNPAEGKAYNPANLPAFSPLYNLSRTGLEDQYSVAKENILSNLPRGGAQGRALANLETGRAKDVGSLQSQISAQIIPDIYNKMYNAAFVTGPQQAMGGMGAAGQLANTKNIAQGTMENQVAMQRQQLETAANAQRAQAAAQSSGLKGAGMGSMLGKGLSAAMPGGGSLFGNAIGGLGNLGKGGDIGSGAFAGSRATASFL